MKDILENLFDKEDDYYSGYLSSEKLDIDEKYIATEITLDDLTKVSRQLDRSVGEVFGIIKVVCSCIICSINVLVKLSLLLRSFTNINLYG